MFKLGHQVDLRFKLLKLQDTQDAENQSHCQAEIMLQIRLHFPLMPVIELAQYRVADRSILTVSSGASMLMSTLATTSTSEQLNILNGHLMTSIFI